MVKELDTDTERKANVSTSSCQKTTRNRGDRQKCKSEAWKLICTSDGFQVFCRKYPAPPVKSDLTFNISSELRQSLMSSVLSPATL